MTCVATGELGEIVPTAQIIPVVLPAAKPVTVIDYELEELALLVANL